MFLISKGVIFTDTALSILSKWFPPVGHCAIVKQLMISDEDWVTSHIHKNMHADSRKDEKTQAPSASFGKMTKHRKVLCSGLFHYHWKTATLFFSGTFIKRWNKEQRRQIGTRAARITTGPIPSKQCSKRVRKSMSALKTNPKPTQTTINCNMPQLGIYSGMCSHFTVFKYTEK